MHPLTPETESKSISERGLILRARFVAIGFAGFFLCAWAAVFYPFDDLVDRFGAPLGGDFPMFYAAGRTVAEGRLSDLYDDQAQQQRIHQLLPNLAEDYSLPYRYPPFVACALAPLSRLPYPAAFATFAMLMLACWWFAAWVLARSIHAPHSQLGPVARWLLIASPIGWEAVIGGQASPLALLIAAGTWYSLRQNRQIVAGAILSLAAYKPNLLAFVILGLLIARPKMIYGVAAVWSLLAVLTVITVGFDGAADYAQYSAHLAMHPWTNETPFWKVHGLGNTLAPIANGYEKIVLLSCGLLLSIVIGIACRTRHDIISTSRAIVGLLLINYLCNLYVPIYDLLTLLAAAAVSVHAVEPHRVSSLLRDRRIQLSLLLIFAGPHVSQGLARSLGWQIFPPAMVAAAIYWIISIARRCTPLGTTSQGGWLWFFKRNQFRIS